MLNGVVNLRDSSGMRVKKYFASLLSLLEVKPPRLPPFVISRLSGVLVSRSIHSKFLRLRARRVLRIVGQVKIVIGAEA